MGSETIAKAWRAVRRAKGIEAAVFRIDSPGGSAVASEVIRQEMARTAEEIPIVVSMSNLAGSGGYWITCGAHRVVADPGTMTGSIGVYGGHLNMDAFWTEKLGVTFGRLDRGANANLYGDLEDWTDAQRMIIDRQLDRIYDQFVDHVSAARDMTRDEVDAIGRGRVFTGEQALENGLVDVLGGFDDALAEAKKLAGIDPDVTVRLVDYPKVLPWWQQMLKKSRDEEAGVRQALEQWWQTGVAQAPGVAWMPPVYVQ
jgi:protease-4